MYFGRSQSCFRGDIHSDLAGVDDVIATVLIWGVFDTGSNELEEIPWVRYRSRDTFGQMTSGDYGVGLWRIA
jgi:hypothetical protein